MKKISIFSTFPKRLLLIGFLLTVPFIYGMYCYVLYYNVSSTVTQIIINRSSRKHSVNKQTETTNKVQKKTILKYNHSKYLSVSYGPITTTAKPLLTAAKTKYILQWTPSRHSPFDLMIKDRFIFLENRCHYKNCYITDDRQYLDNITQFHAIVFNGKEVHYMNKTQLPQIRDPRQKYVFATLESAHYYPICQSYLDNFFNWTWTYRLDSDVRWDFVKIYDSHGVIGPNNNMKWQERYEPISDEIKSRLAHKSKAAAWFVSNCPSKGKREDFVGKLQKELKAFSLSVDIYGWCGDLVCPKSDLEYCYSMLEKNYYFYFAFENSLSVDYVTEKLLTAVNHFTVPVVYGAANYSRFLPPGSYLNAMHLGPSKLARTMYGIIKNPRKYYNFFRWKAYYRYEAASKDMCKLCEFLNDKEKFEAVSVHKNFREWWNEKDIKSCNAP